MGAAICSVMRMYLQSKHLTESESKGKTGSAWHRQPMLLYKAPQSVVQSKEAYSLKLDKPDLRGHAGRPDHDVSCSWVIGNQGSNWCKSEEPRG
jgi:hypothetical protein